MRTDRSSTNPSEQFSEQIIPEEKEYDGRLSSRTALSTVPESNLSSTSRRTPFHDDRSIFDSDVRVSSFPEKRTWTDYQTNDSSSIDHAHSFLNYPLSDEYHQHIHLSNGHEIFYEKQFEEAPLEFSHSPSYDRFSTLTYQHVKETNQRELFDPKEEICVLYLGPNGRRGFEENHTDERSTTENPSKLSLLTLKSHSFSDG